MKRSECDGRASRHVYFKMSDRMHEDISSLWFTYMMAQKISKFFALDIEIVETQNEYTKLQTRIGNITLHIHRTIVHLANHSSAVKSGT